MHLAELLATAGNLGYERPEETAAPRPAPPSAAARAAVLGPVAAAVAVTGAAVGKLLRARLARSR
jgi:hypothetical protein